MATKKATRPARRSSSSSAPSSDANNGTDQATDQPIGSTSSEAAARMDALDTDPDDDDGPANAREYFARCARPLSASATIDDVCSVLEALGVSTPPETHATPHGL